MKTQPPLARRAMLGAALVLALPDLARGQSQLYEAPPPPGSAWLRFVNALGQPVSVRPNFLPARELGTEAGARIGPYSVVEQVAGRRLSLALETAGRRGGIALTVEPGSFTTVVLHASGVGAASATAITDQADFNRARARLAFYNAAPGCGAAELRLAPTGSLVFQGLGPLATQARAVTPVAATVVALCDGVATAPLALAGLDAGGSYSIWLMQPPDSEAFALFTPDVLARRAA